MALSACLDGAKHITRLQVVFTYTTKNTAVVYSSIKLTESVSILHPSFACNDVSFIGVLGHDVTVQFPATLFSFILSENSISTFVGTFIK